MVLAIQKNAMQDSTTLNDSQMLSYVGGGAVSASLVNAINSIVRTFYGVGQNLGSTFRRLISRNYC